MIRKNLLIILIVTLFLHTVSGYIIELNFTNGGLLDIATCPESGWDCVDNVYVYGAASDQSKMGVTSNHPYGKGESKIYAKFNLSSITENYNMITQSNFSLFYSEGTAGAKDIGCWEFYDDTWSSWDNYRKTNATWNMSKDDHVIDYGIEKTSFDVTEAVKKEFNGDKIITLGLGNYTGGDWAYAYRTHSDQPTYSFKLIINAVNCGDGKVEEGETCENCKKDFFSDKLKVKNTLSVSADSNIIDLYLNNEYCSYDGEINYKIYRGNNTFEFSDNITLNQTSGDWEKIYEVNIPDSLELTIVNATFNTTDGQKNLNFNYKILCDYSGTSSLFKCPVKCSDDYCRYEIKSFCGDSSGVVEKGGDLPNLFCRKGGSILIIAYSGDISFEGSTTTTTTTTTTIPQTTTTLPQTTTTQPTTTTTIPISSCSGKSYTICNSLSNCQWVGNFRIGSCQQKTVTTTTTTTIPQTTTTLPQTTTTTTTTIESTTTTTIPIACSGKNFLLCVFSSGCKWSGDLRIGKCVEK